MRKSCGPLSLEHRKKIGDGNRNKKRSAETLAKLSAAHAGVPLSDSHSANISAALKGRVFSVEHGRKISERKKGVKFSEEHKAKLRAVKLLAHAEGRAYKIKPECGIAGVIASRKRAGTFDMSDEDRKLRKKMILFMRGTLRRMMVLLQTETAPKPQAYINVILGYTYEQLRDHLQALFMDGMTWENYGAWEIDHICPVSYFIRTGVTDPSVVNALSNLQPLWKAENVRKRDRVTA